ncbi:MAG: recombination protein O N-terminal domain-containing protein [Flavobacteriales bacterium]|jgi:DNA repair protein RecO (recombination protein O)|nr:recombination protein O N-terminal domain-containing protein [Flavobacteriales bacterium]
MLHTTRAVVLRLIKYGDKSVVLHAYTEEFGARSYMLRPARKGKPIGLGPLERVELVVAEDARRDLHHVREFRVERPYLQIPGQPARGLVLLFMQEVCCRTLKEEAGDPELFSFVQSQLEELDSTDDLPHYPLFLLARMARQFGFLPAPPRPGEDCFDLREGSFFNGTCGHGEFLGKSEASAFAALLKAEASRTPLQLSAIQRTALLEGLLDFFRLHVPGFGQLKSPAVLHAVLG